MKSSQNLPAKLKEYRKKNHYSQEYVAEYMNLTRQAISNWETGKATPDLDNLVMLSELYGITVDELLGEEEKYNDSTYGVVASNDINSHIEKIVLATILIISFNLPIIGMPVAIIITLWLIYTKRNYKLIYCLCLLCVIMSLHELFVMYSHFNKLHGMTFLISK